MLWRPQKLDCMDEGERKSWDILRRVSSSIDGKDQLLFFVKKRLK
jgi:hypothetical protein